MRNRLKWSILFLLIAATLPFILFGWSQQPFNRESFNRESEKKEAEARPTSKDGSQNKEAMMRDIQSKLLEGYKQVTIEEAKKQLGFALMTPKYLPERFQHYGIFIRDNPGIPTEKMVKQLWVDSKSFELLLVTQSKLSDKDQEGQIIFTDGLETPGKISDVFPWAKYRCQYEFTKNGNSAQGYMLVNDEGKRDEYEKILKSLKE
ncbi:MAG: hypothetical protein AB1510_11810 [Bacillota bacterium]